MLDAIFVTLSLLLLLLTTFLVTLSFCCFFSLLSLKSFGRNKSMDGIRYENEFQLTLRRLKSDWFINEKKITWAITIYINYLLIFNSKMTLLYSKLVMSVCCEWLSLIWRRAKCSRSRQKRISLKLYHIEFSLIYWCRCLQWKFYALLHSHWYIFILRFW